MGAPVGQWSLKKGSRLVLSAFPGSVQRQKLLFPQPYQGRKYFYNTQINLVHVINKLTSENQE